MAMDAMIDAVNQAYELAVQEAHKCLKNYLKRKPKIYKRLNPSPLRKAVYSKEPDWVKNGKNKCVIEFSIIYDAKRIKGAYKSNSWYHQSGDKWVSRFDGPDTFEYNWQSNGIPDSEWILNNYLQGIHPGYDRNGVDHGWVDAESPSSRLTNFFENELPKKSGTLIYQAMHGAIIDFIKTNGGGR